MYALDFCLFFFVFFSNFINYKFDVVTQRNSRSKLLVGVNDLRAMCYISMGTQAGAKAWACRYGNCLGIYIALLDVVIYPGVARQLHKFYDGRDIPPAVSRLLREWKRHFRGLPKVLALLDRPMFRRDHAFRMEAGQLAEEAKQINAACHKRAVRAGGYHGIGKSVVI